MGRMKKEKALHESIRKPVAPLTKVETPKKHKKEKYPLDTYELWPVGEGLNGK